MVWWHTSGRHHQNSCKGSEEDGDYRTLHDPEGKDRKETNVSGFTSIICNVNRQIVGVMLNGL